MEPPPPPPPPLANLDSLPSEAGALSPRPRGRPPKSEMKKSRGRPKKMRDPDDLAPPAKKVKVNIDATANGSSKKRGRPFKVKSQAGNATNALVLWNPGTTSSAQPDPLTRTVRGPPKPRFPIPVPAKQFGRSRGRPAKVRDPNSSPANKFAVRSRGRPPKAIDLNALPSTSSSRPRGRPPKAVTTSSKAIDTNGGPPVGSVRPRGRPPKVAARSPGRPPKAAAYAAAAIDLKQPPGTPSGRARGRPPKVKDDTISVPAVTSPSGRPRGRPPKVNNDGNSTAAAVEGGEPATPSSRPRGRPPKVKDLNENLNL